MITSNKCFFSFICLVFLIGLVSAYSPHKLTSDLQFSITSNNATQCNVTTMDAPEGTSTINQEMTKSGQTFNSTITSGNFTITGDYCFNIVCTDGSQYASGNICKAVTVTGNDLSSAKSSTYILIFIVSLLIFVGLLILGIALPSGDKRDEMTGYILAISNLKYLKLVFLGLAYITLIWISYFVWMISYAYLDMAFMSSILQFVFYFLAVCTLPLFIFFVYLTISNLTRDSGIKDLMSRGIKSR